MDIKIRLNDEGGVSGSGVSIGQGRVVTANHVVQLKGQAIVAAKTSGVKSECRILAQDINRDLALLQCDGFSNDSRLQLAGVSEVRTGSRILLSGSPTVLPIIVTHGIVSGALEQQGKLILDAESGPGGSGGPVFTLGGRLVGLLQAGHMFPPWVVFTTSNLQLRRFLHNALPKEY